MKKVLSGVSLIAFSVVAVSLTAQEKGGQTERVDVKVSTKVVDKSGKVSTQMMTANLELPYLKLPEVGTKCTGGTTLKKVTKVTNAMCKINDTASVCSCDQEVNLKCDASGVYTPEFKKVLSNCQQTAVAIPKG